MDQEALNAIVQSLENISLEMGQIEGVPLPQFACDAWDIVHNFQAREDDILVATYPKAGTTWAHEIADLVLLEGDVERAMRALRSSEIITPKSQPSDVSNILYSALGFLRPRCIILHLSTLKLNCHNSHHFVSLPKSFVIWLIPPGTSTLLQIFVSSAKRHTFPLIPSAISLIKILKRIGPTSCCWFQNE
uniref:Sulfotransferase n=1 Tax=Leptobrachium leishanense TaxID=445787 RepID=A0A8C5PU88_9ANUR